MMDNCNNHGSAHWNHLAAPSLLPLYSLKKYKTMRIPITLSYVFFFLLLSSCYHNKRLIYLQDRHFSEKKTTLMENKKEQYRLQPADILSVQVKSTAEKEVSSIFNVTSLQNPVFVSPGNLYLEGYSIDISGKITLPILGAIAVKDLTLEEAQKVIQSHADKYLNQSTVILKLTSFKVTVLGEVKNPGYYLVFNNQATVLEALGLAGDLTSFGNRENVKLIRQTPAGSEVIFLDLTDSSLLKSEYFFLTPGDVLYVEPFKARSKRTNLELLSVVFSGLTTGVLIFSYINSND
jgi:polysaccharide biosynthesis/export protein